MYEDSTPAAAAAPPKDADDDDEESLSSDNEDADLGETDGDSLGRHSAISRRSWQTKLLKFGGRYCTDSNESPVSLASLVKCLLGIHGSVGI